jgi:cell division initiation protein
MPYTPVELRHVKLGRALFGFKRDETEKLIEEIADSFEDVWRERGELTDRVHELDQKLEEIGQREALLSATLVSAEKSAVESRDAAKRQAEVIIAEAHGEARSIMRSAQSERERLFAEVRRIESLLRSALGIVVESRGGTGETGAGVPSAAPEAPEAPQPPAASAPMDEARPPAAPSAEAPPPAAAEPAAEAGVDVPKLPPPPDQWPRREDTREFAIVRTEDQPQLFEGGSDGSTPSLPDPEEPGPREFAWGD